jgi:hypothetical protein
VQSDVSKLGHEVANVRGRVQKIEGEFTPAMVETVKSITYGVEGAAAADIDREEIVKLVEEKTKEQNREMEDRARRCKNLVIFGLPEPDNRENQDRKKEDGSKAEQLLGEVRIGHKPVDIRRLGTYSPNAERPRPLRLTFATQTVRDEVMQAIRKAKREAGNGGEGDGKLCTSISVRKDLTPTERKEEEALFQEMKEKQKLSEEPGDTNARWVRKNGRVVNVGRQPNLEAQGKNKE